MGIDLARKQGVKVGFLRLVVVWPFPEKRIRELAAEEEEAHDFEIAELFEDIGAAAEEDEELAESAGIETEEAPAEEG